MTKQQLATAMRNRMACIQIAVYAQLLLVAMQACLVCVMTCTLLSTLSVAHQHVFSLFLAPDNNTLT